MSQLNRIIHNTQEIVTHDELEALLKEKDKPSAYIGIEPSGLVHIGSIICIDKVKDLLDSGFKVTILLADWHAYLNDKLGGDIESSRVCGEYIKDCFFAFGVESKDLEFVYATDLLNGIEYWEKVLRISKKSSLSRIKRTLTIMGRKEDEADMDASMLIYPAMQVADIFQLDVDVAYGGMDQRKAHMLARDISEKLGLKKVVAIHTPLLSGLTGGGRMDPIEAKMSKSNPENSIFIHDSLEDIKRKIKKAYCPEGQIDDNPIIDICRYIIFNRKETMTISRPQKFGGDLQINGYAELNEIFSSGGLHPEDLKNATATYLSEILESAREYFEKNPENYERVRAIDITR
ncbi:MAG: tyrosine--tRNA ligase [Methanomassiliicoccales archaeon]|nr:MAG: tyrosine--tRNA ligase [Methanomassiliicoccales archaeon]